MEPSCDGETVEPGTGGRLGMRPRSTCIAMLMNRITPISPKG